MDRCRSHKPFISFLSTAQQGRKFYPFALMCLGHLISFLSQMWHLYESDAQEEE